MAKAMQQAATTLDDSDSQSAKLAEEHLRRLARSLFWRGLSLTQIAEETGANYNTVASWKRRDEWHKAAHIDVVEDRLEAKVAQLLDKEPFTEGDMKRVDFMMRQLERAARIRKFNETGKDGDLNPKIAKRNDEKARAKQAKARKNFLTLEQWQALLDDFEQWRFEYQDIWWEQRDQRTRKLRKARQIGATVYFAREAVAKIAEAVLNDVQPRNQIFLSASQRQSLKFRREIYGWVKRVTGVELKGKEITFDFAGLDGEEGEGDNGAPELDGISLYFLSTNSATAQGESGDFYFDEYAWVHGFGELKRVASAMATHRIYKRTYFSTPSTKTHESWAFWSGEEWNKGRRKGEQKSFDLSQANLRDGAIMPDGSWQQCVTIHDAVARGLGSLVDVDELRSEYSEEEFRNLFECEDVDDSESSFPWALLAPARVDSFLKWRDFKPAEVDIPGRRPFGEKPVWIGYDPNRQGRDDAALAVVAPPDVPGKGTFRVLEKFRLNGLDFQGQADFIEKVAARYNVTDIAIDTSGSGLAVWNLVRAWFPRVRKIEYTLASKTELVLKGQNVFRKQRIEFDAGWTDVVQAFMAIRPALTGSQKGVTYKATRNGTIGHADIAFAILHSLSNEPMDAGTAHQGGGGRVAVSR